MLTEEQKAHFEAFGFLMLPRLFNSDEVGVMRKACMEVVDREGGANALRDAEGWSIGGLMERHPVLMPFLDDDRIYEIPETLLGPDFVLEMTDGHVRAGNTPWHGRDPRNEKSATLHRANVRVCIYFDSLNKETGCLRVIPGSHLRPFADNLHLLGNQYDDSTSMPFGVMGPEVPCVALESEPGDVVIFTESVQHGSFGGRARLQLTTQYIANPTTEEHLAQMREWHDGYKWGFHPAESAINSDRPRVRRMVSRLVELGYTPLPV